MGQQFKVGDRGQESEGAAPTAAAAPARVDVLAVMDTDGRAIALYADTCVGLRKTQWEAHLRKHDEARDAVRELIEAVADVYGDPCVDEANAADDPCTPNCPSCRIRAALAQVSP